MALGWNGWNIDMQYEVKLIIDTKLSITNSIVQDDNQSFYDWVRFVLKSEIVSWSWGEIFAFQC